MREHAWLEAKFAEIRPKAMAALLRYFRDVDLAEEAFSQACIRALQQWDKKGLPKDPLAWLLRVGRNAGLDVLRHNKTRSNYAGEVQKSSSHLDQENVPLLPDEEIRDDILRLLFICCHPVLSPQDQAALALKIVTGLSVEQIAQAFLIKPKAMEQRITRAKKTIEKENTPFESPDNIQRARRLNNVSLMIYLLFNEGWSASSGEVQIKALLCEEAIYLSRLLLRLFPSQTELMGLLALCLFQHARQEARLKDDKLIPLDEQDRSLWNRNMIFEAEALLEKALWHHTPGRYQVHAAIAAVHSKSQNSASTNWAEIERLYELLYRFEPTPIVKLNHLSAVARVKGPYSVIPTLQGMAYELQSYRWYHTTLAGLLAETQQPELARQSYEAALNLSPTAQEEEVLLQKIKECTEF